MTDLNTKILGLRTTIYKVSDLTKAKDWYSKAFDAVPYFDEPFYVGFNIGGYELGLIPEKESNGNAGGVLTYWGVNDLDAVYQKFLSFGAEPNEEPHNVGGEIIVGAVEDPWGNIVGIIYNPDFNLPN